MGAKTDSQPKILSKPELPGATGLSQRTIDDLIERRLFPPPARLSARRIGWFVDEIDQWREQRRQERDAAIAAGTTIGTQFQTAGSEK